MALLYYPLGLALDPEIAENDLDFYTQMTDKSNFFTGDSSYSIAYLALGNRSAADAQLPLAFSHIDTAHYNTWIECFLPYCHLHFITGAGGFLQNFVYGYGSLRVTDAGPKSRLEFSHPYPQLPPGGVTSLKLRGIAFLGQRLDMWYNASTICLSLSVGFVPSGAPALQAVLQTSGQTLQLNSTTPSCAQLQPGYIEPA